jgi:hypothetical protein
MGSDIANSQSAIANWPDRPNTNRKSAITKGVWRDADCF